MTDAQKAEILELSHATLERLRRREEEQEIVREASDTIPHFDPVRRRRNWRDEKPSPKPVRERQVFAVMVDIKVAEAIAREREEMHGVLAELLAQIQDEVAELKQSCVRDYARLENLIETWRSVDKAKTIDLPAMPLSSKPN